MAIKLSRHETRQTYRTTFTWLQKLTRHEAIHLHQTLRYLCLPQLTTFIVCLHKYESLNKPTLPPMFAKTRQHGNMQHLAQHASNCLIDGSHMFFSKLMNWTESWGLKKGLPWQWPRRHRIFHIHFWKGHQVSPFLWINTFHNSNNSMLEWACM